MIVVDWNENVVDCHRDNAIVLQKWEGDNSDRSLIGLAQLLNGMNSYPRGPRGAPNVMELRQARF